MNRRAFISSLATGLLLPRAIHATPAATPSPRGRPDAVDLGEGMILADYRVLPGDRAYVIGELRSDREEMIDAPVVSLAWPDARGEERFTWASPIFPVIKPGSAIPVFGPLPVTSEPEALLRGARFSLCSPVTAGHYTELERSLNLKVRMTNERYRELSYKGEGRITNESSTVTEGTIGAGGIVRDADDRIAGVTTNHYRSRIGANSSRDFVVWMAESLDIKANPVPLLDGLNYSIEIVVGINTPGIAPGCDTGLPWE